jgi:hypothetical protein
MPHPCLHAAHINVSGVLFVVVVEELFVILVEFGIVELVVVVALVIEIRVFVIADIIGLSTRLRNQDLFLEKRFDPAAQFHEDSFDKNLGTRVRCFVVPVQGARS